MKKQQTREPGSSGIDNHAPASPPMILALPAELRVEIWRLVLGGIVVQISREHRTRIHEPALTWSSRQIRAETLPIFFAHSIFDGRHEAMLEFFGLIGRQNIELIRHVRHTRHVGLNTLDAIRLTLRILSGAYETLGLPRDALHLPLMIEGEGETYVNLQEASQVTQVWMGPGLSAMPIVRRVKESSDRNKSQGV
ncbi:putative F-box domain-containing protein [Seiridium unicorne]|uniref:F-box domain-containing protein n=1 Tax=Seiridium unicorne TaxID=138068 RepID=A0ABR2UFH6_9PEZI